MIIHGDCLEELKKLPDNSIDSVVTDPPYGLSKEPNITEVLTKWMAGEDYEHRSSGFMGKSWDSFVPGPAIWKEVYRVLKPGGHILCFAGTRTQDLMTISLRLAGFEVRDCISYLYFSGFPKSKNHVKPAHEPIILCRKPIEKTVAYNVEKYGTGGLNIDASRIKMTAEDYQKYLQKLESFDSTMMSGKHSKYGVNTYSPAKTKHYDSKAHDNKGGRFPANCITLDDDQFYSKYFNITPQELSKKASKKDRNSDWKGEEITLESVQPVRFSSENGSGQMLPSKKSGLESHKVKGNFHPTCKPTLLMSWLIRLITPVGGIVLDPFAGSGSTLVAAKREGFNYVGIEKEMEYINIINARIS